ncbi:MAG: 3-deoxy-8-phosphooctulonate synthase [Bacteroidetes bacterium]|jgi:2-dehydro-3-deoxyphosphooctonate aldolase (KDO 8-P synthase)|nr:3-deoxy-8-phosphooctulonate synthase [Bacteroidota bacterium]
MKIPETIPLLKHVHSGNFFLIAGPCVIESRELCFEVAERITAITNKLEIPYVFKSSYKKANRSKLDSFTGIGDKAALDILKEVRKQFNIPVLTDIHSPEEAYFASQYADVLQIPAFLCRQTDLLVAAAKTGKTINVKKGQFLAPESMKFVVEKIMESGNHNIILTDRGTMFGYNDLIVDFRGLVEMRKLKFPVVLDITHSLQQPNQQTGISGGKPELIETMARAAIAIGVDGIFIETHPEPMLAKSDGANMLKLDLLEHLLEKLVKIRKTILDFEE